MIQMALDRSAAAEKRWTWLLETDGGKGSLDECTGEWTEFSPDPVRDQ